MDPGPRRFLEEAPQLTSVRADQLRKSVIVMACLALNLQLRRQGDVIQCGQAKPLKENLVGEGGLAILVLTPALYTHYRPCLPWSSGT